MGPYTTTALTVQLSIRPTTTATATTTTTNTTTNKTTTTPTELKRTLAPANCCLIIRVKVVNIHRAGPGAFEGLVTNHMGEYLANPDAKVSRTLAPQATNKSVPHRTRATEGV